MNVQERQMGGESQGQGSQEEKLQRNLDVQTHFKVFTGSQSSQAAGPS